MPASGAPRRASPSSRRSASAEGPMSHADVAGELASHGLDRATVYRNLMDLADAGLVSRADHGDHVWRFSLLREKRRRGSRLGPPALRVHRLRRCLVPLRRARSRRRAAELHLDAMRAIARGRPLAADEAHRAVGEGTRHRRRRCTRSAGGPRRDPRRLFRGGGRSATRDRRDRRGSRALRRRDPSSCGKPSRDRGRAMRARPRHRRGSSGLRRSRASRGRRRAARCAGGRHRAAPRRDRGARVPSRPSRSPPARGRGGPSSPASSAFARVFAEPFVTCDHANAARSTRKTP